MVEAAALSDTKRRLLEKCLRENLGSVVPATEVSPMRSHGPVPVSLFQEQLLLREQRDHGIPPLYNECIKLRMKGPLDLGVLAKSISEIIRRHEAWRTSYDLEDAHLVQVIHSASEGFELPAVDLRGLPKAQADAEIQRLAGEAVQQPFDLKNGPLLRARMFRTADCDHSLFLSAHLSIVDGVSVYQVFPSELAVLYRAYSHSEASPLPDLDAQFSDYAHWQRQQWLQSDQTRTQVAYWQKQLAGPIPRLNWLLDRPRPARETFRGVIRSFTLDNGIVEALEALARQQSVSLFMGLLAAFAGLLHLYTRQEDIVVGTPSPAGRKRAQTQKLLGYFLNPVALRFDLTGNPAFHCLLRQAQRLTLEALSNDEVPLEFLARELAPNADPGRHPFFTVAISLQPPAPQLDLDWTLTSMDIESGGSPWDLYLAFIKRPAETLVRAQYNPDLFDASTITRMIDDYEALLRVVTDNPACRISQIDLSSRVGAATCPAQDR